MCAEVGDPDLADFDHIAGACDSDVPPNTVLALR